MTMKTAWRDMAIDGDMMTAEVIEIETEATETTGMAMTTGGVEMIVEMTGGETDPHATKLLVST